MSVQNFAVLRSIVAVLRDPNQTAHGARMVMALDRRRMEANYHRFAQSPEGVRILRSGAPTLFDRLCDREALARLPEGSLGRRYLDFVVREGISTEALDREVAPVEEEILGRDPERRRFGRHMRASHDLWHVLTGYHRDLFGELQLLAFSQPQTSSRAFAWIVRMARLHIERQIPGARTLLDLAGERGRAAPWLPEQDWGRLLPEPLVHVREQLRIGAPPVYTRYVRRPEGFGLVPEEGI